MTTSNLLDGFTVGDFQVFPREEKIVGGDSSHHVEPKVMQVLVTLASNAGHTVSRDQILEEVWSDAVVGDEVLSRAISLLRGYFGDERTSPRYIRTVPRKGYELIAEVGVVAAGGNEEHGRDQPGPSVRVGGPGSRTGGRHRSRRALVAGHG